MAAALRRKTSERRSPPLILRDTSLSAEPCGHRPVMDGLLRLRRRQEKVGPHRYSDQPDHHGDVRDPSLGIEPCEGMTALVVWETVRFRTRVAKETSALTGYGN